VKIDPPESEWLELRTGELFKIKTSSGDTGGKYVVLELEVAPRHGVRLHTHDNEEEHLIIVEGTLQAAVGGKIQDFPAGTSFTVGKGIPHAWVNPTDSLLRIVVIFTPGGIEQMFRAVAEKKVDDIEAFFSSYGTHIIGPGFASWS
jgi:quercetin dioxygenase-like cupin family protein